MIIVKISELQTNRTNQIVPIVRTRELDLSYAETWIILSMEQTPLLHFPRPVILTVIRLDILNIIFEEVSW